MTDSDRKTSEESKGEIMATKPQIVVLNNMLPPKYRFESCEKAQKLAPSNVKTEKRTKTVSLF